MKIFFVQDVVHIVYKGLVMTTKDNTNFQSFTKYWIFDNGFAEGDVIVIDHGHITGKWQCALPLKIVISKLN